MMKTYFKIVGELIVYIGFAVLGSSIAVWILQNIFEVFYYG
jgi:hypothetical protein